MMGGPGAGMPDFMGQPRPLNMEAGDVQVHFTVPPSQVGAIIGKGGEQIKTTAASAGCRVSMSNREAGERRAMIVGNYTQVVAAENMIHEQIAQSAAAAGQEYREVSFVFFVRKEVCGAVIGKQGATLQEIREATGVQVQLSRNDMDGLRPCQIKGSFESVMQAQQMIYENIEPSATIEAGRRQAAAEHLPSATPVAPDPASVPPAVAAAWHQASP